MCERSYFHCLQFHDFAQRVRDAGITFIIEPHLRFEGACHVLYQWLRFARLS
jgi:extradiol dioxygenase family protein